MSVVAEAPAEITSAAQIPEKTLLSGLALTSFAALLLELALTRLFSVVLFYHFAFLVVSKDNFCRLAWLYLAAPLPFFLTGLLFSVVFARETHRIPRMYGAELC